MVADTDGRRRVRVMTFVCRLRASSQREDGKTVEEGRRWEGGGDGEDRTTNDEHRHLPPAVAKCASPRVENRPAKLQNARPQTRDALVSKTTARMDKIYAKRALR
ncbi:hypothetical protein AB1N83_013940 [Pleurotus pulmonarius]